MCAAVHRPVAALLLAAGAVSALAGCATPEPQPAEPPAAALPESPPQAEAPEKATGSAGKILVYNAITGHVPVRQQSTGGLSGPGREAVRTATLEAEIEEELARQEDLSGRIEAEQGSASPDSEPIASGPALPDPDNPRIAPEAPRERDLPLSIFDSQRETVPADTWGNAESVTVVRRTLDVDEDGTPEQVRYFDADSGELLRKEQDRDYDGRMDAWYSYEGGSLVERVLDASGDGRGDVWERYAQDRMTERTIDRDDDGVKDAFYRYQGEMLADERHDANNDGQIDLIVTYENLHRVRAEEDRDRDGRIDTWTVYQTVDGEDFLAKVEHDSRGRGSADLVETFEVQDGRALLARREEDVDGDGTVDVVSRYRNGKLVAREISDPDLAPL